MYVPREGLSSFLAPYAAKGSNDVEFRTSMDVFIAADADRFHRCEVAKMGEGECSNILLTSGEKLFGFTV